MSIREQVAQDLDRNDLLADRVRAVTRVLDEVVGDSGVEVKAAWELGADAQGRPVVKLRLTDFTGQADATFAPDELTVTSQLRRRLHWLWGNLLQDRARRQINEAITLGSDGEG